MKMNEPELIRQAFTYEQAERLFQVWHDLKRKTVTVYSDNDVIYKKDWPYKAHLDEWEAKDILSYALTFGE